MIKSVVGKILFEYEEKGNSIKRTLEKAVKEGADLKGAYLKGADLKGAYLEGADLKGAKNITLSQIDFISELESISNGIIVYKSFGEHYKPPETWKIEPNSVISESVDGDRTATCSSGINVGTREWCEANCSKKIWKCLVRWEWLPGVVVPYQTDGKFRVEKLELLEQLP